MPEYYSVGRNPIPISGVTHLDAQLRALELASAARRVEIESLAKHVNTLYIYVLVAFITGAVGVGAAFFILVGGMGPHS